MSPHVFIERSRLGKSFYELRGDHLSISGRRFLQRYEIEVELSDASPQFERLALRFFRPIVVQLSIGAAMSCLTAALLLQKFIPAEALHHYVLAAGISAAGFVGGGLTWIPRVKVARFRAVGAAPTGVRHRSRVARRNAGGDQAFRAQFE